MNVLLTAVRGLSLDFRHEVQPMKSPWLVLKWKHFATIKSNWVGDFYIICSPLLGEMIQFDEHIFQMGWNHQLGKYNMTYQHVPTVWCMFSFGWSICRKILRLGFNWVLSKKETRCSPLSFTVSSHQYPSQSCSRARRVLWRRTEGETKRNHFNWAIWLVCWS